MVTMVMSTLHQIVTFLQNGVTLLKFWWLKKLIKIIMYTSSIYKLMAYVTEMLLRFKEHTEMNWWDEILVTRHNLELLSIKMVFYLNMKENLSEGWSKIFSMNQNNWLKAKDFHVIQLKLITWYAIAINLKNHVICITW